MTQVNYIVHSSVGKILRYGECPSDMLSIQAQQGETVIEGKCNSFFTEYVLGGKVVPKLPNPTVLTGTTLTNCPVGSTLLVNSDSFVTTDPTIELTFDYPGTYRMSTVLFPYLAATFTVTV